MNHTFSTPRVSVNAASSLGAIQEGATVKIAAFDLDGTIIRSNCREKDDPDDKLSITEKVT
jgi:hypothetical protein